MPKQPIVAKLIPVSALVLVIWLYRPPHARATDGIFGTGAGARSMSMGGASVAIPDSPQASMSGNPAGLSLLSAPTADAGFVAASPYGAFTSKTGQGGNLSSAFDFAPEGAIATPIHNTPFSIGIGVIPQTGLSAHWNYPDPPGGLGGLTTYGQQRDNSEIEEIRFAMAVSIALTRQLSIGGSFGVDYNQNLLQAPYIFQSQAVLRGFKTLLNLSTSGWGPNGSVGILYRPCDTVAIGLSYQGRTYISTYGEATGDASAQLNALGPGFAGVRRDFHYNAEVDNNFPQVASGGVAWKFHPGWVATAEVDWTGWSNAFDTLPVKLTNGDNRQINALVGSPSMEDDIPLRWKDEFSYRVGLEDEVAKNLFLRVGYSYSKSPVPSETLTPLTAVLPENSITAGAGYVWRWLELDLAYEWDIPMTRHVGASALADGEYSNSTVRDGIQWLGLTTQVRF